MKYVRDISSIILIAGVMVLFNVFVTAPYLYDVVSGAPSKIERWLETYKGWSIYLTGTSLVSALLWYVLSQWFFKLNYWAKSGKRPVWSLLIAPPLLVTAIGIVLTPAAKEGMWLVYFFYFVSALIPYYLGTALFSPSSFKYAPVGSQLLRRWW